MKRSWKECFLFGVKLAWRGYVVLAIATILTLPYFIYLAINGIAIFETATLSIATVGLTVLFLITKDKNKFWNTLLWK